MNIFKTRIAVVPDSLTFPVTRDMSVIPPNIRCYDIDLNDGSPNSLKYMKCSSIFYVDSPDCWSIARVGENSEEYHIDILFVVSGVIFHRNKNGIGKAVAGQMLMIPSIENRLVWAEETSCYIYARFDCEEIQYGIGSTLVRNCPCIDEVVSFTKFLMNARHEKEKASAYRLHLLECMAILFRRELHIKNNAYHQEKIAKMLDLLQKESDNSLTVEIMADKMALSLSTLRKFCLLNFDKTPKELIEENRMSKARVLLTYSDLPIESIAEQLGFADRYAFSKAFCRVNKISPARFRKSK